MIQSAIGRSKLSAEQHTNLGQVIETLLEWQENGIPLGCLVWLVRENDWFDVSHITKVDLITRLEKYQDFIRQDGEN